MHRLCQQSNMRCSQTTVANSCAKIHASIRGDSAKIQWGRAPHSGSSRSSPLVSRARPAGSAEDLVHDSQYSGESFYDIIGVAADADSKEIKLAYYSIMRDCHPDQCGVYDESTELCKMLNEIYDTLMDPERRSAYDDLAGFSYVATNPFMRNNQERDLVFVDEYTCIGCRNCNHVCPKTFTMEEDWGRARVMRQRVDNDEKLQEAIDTCPVSCIHWVSAPQLSLLEAAMARMERVAVWSLMSGGGANIDVFTEASIAWEKRYTAMQARRDAAVAAARSGNGNGNGATVVALGSFWGMMQNASAPFGPASGSRMYEQAKRARESESSRQREGFGGADALGPKEVRGIAALAARAARASRTWKVYQDTERARRGGSAQLTVMSSASSLDEEEEMAIM